jgi:threonine aldolase
LEEAGGVLSQALTAGNIMSFTFASDNASTVHPKIMEAIAAANHGSAPPYGADDVSKTLNSVYSEIFEREAFVFPVSSGTAANGLALSLLTPSYGAVFCHRLAHILASEAGAAEFFSGGCRLIPIEGDLCKLSSSTLSAATGAYGAAQLHQMKAATLSLTQATERGTLYQLDELRALNDFAHKSGLKVHMDGARFANALAALGCTPAEMTWKSGVDALSFGATKNGAMMAEAVVVFDAAIAEELRFRHKRAGFLQSKMRYFTAQLLAYVKDDLWLDTAKRANAAAQRLGKVLAGTPGVELAFPVESNQIFVYLPPALGETLALAGLRFRPWAGPKPDLHRLVLSWADGDETLQEVEAVLAQHHPI